MNWKHIFARKDLETLLAEAAGEHRLHRVLGPWSLTALGVGCIIGAGIFVMTGRAAAQDAGPAVILSYAIAGLGCVVAALCYAEFAAMAPVAGSAYTYAYTTLGEIFAWIIGWDLILEYAMGCATVASAWTSYLNELLLAVARAGCGSRDAFARPVQRRRAPALNLPSVLIMALVTIILVLGIRESARTNATLVVIKLAVVLFVIAVGWGYVQAGQLDEHSRCRRALPEEKKLIPRRSRDHGCRASTLERARQSYPRLSRHKNNSRTKSIAATAWSEAATGGRQLPHRAQQEDDARLQEDGRLSADGRQTMLQT